MNFKDMKNRKTFDVETFKKFVNEQLARTDIDANESFKEGFCCTIEKVLHQTGNYHGFQYLYWDEFGCDEWEKNGKTENWKEKELFIYGSPTSKYRGNRYAKRYY